VHPYPTVVLANGERPAHAVALGQLRGAATIVCCDGAAQSLLQLGMTPTYIVGDMDSLSPALRQRFADRIYHESEQESNDLTKAIRLCRAKGLRSATILGATGKREDHTLGNISLLAGYADELSVQMLTGYGALHVASGHGTFASFAGQQVSLFCLSAEARITTGNLRYPLHDSPLPALWMGTLNESQGDTFSLRCTGKVVVFREYPAG
jgi:thiamine pyrophosphokinase